MHYMEALMLITTAEYVAPTSDENVTVTDTEFSNVAVRLFVPRRAPDGLRRAVIYFHGGGWCVGHAGERFGRRREDLKVLRTTFCFVGAATKRVKELVFHQLKPGGGVGNYLKASAKRNGLLYTCLSQRYRSIF